MVEKRKFHIFDTVESPTKCPKCGISAWMIDGDGRGKFWLLCLAPNNPECVECIDLPEDIEVIL
jgi:hypothetical protein